jgi:threonine aldolase
MNGRSIIRMIDLRSDTVTRPTEAMLESMRNATYGDDSRDGDETVRRLESIAAGRMGKAAAAYMPSGTMTNLVAVLAHAERGGEVLLESGAHMLNSELGGIAAIAGTFYRGLPGHRGSIDLESLRESIRGRTRRNFGTALVCMETTHNRAGGAVLPLDAMRAVHTIAADHDVPVHIDGARIFNAAAALGTAARAIAEHGDSVCFCVSKALSAPVGSLLCGSEDFIARARAFRRMVGGNMRQAGPLAAAGIVALETMIDRLGEDHAAAKRLASGLHAIHPDLVDPEDVDTNLVKVHVRTEGPDAAAWAAELEKHGIRVSPCERHALRFVTHRHIGDIEVDAAIAAFADIARRFNSER